MSRRLEDLAPDVLAKAQAFLAACEADGLDVLVTCTWRSDEEQTALYAKGRTAPGAIVTNAKAGQSKHNGTKDGKPCARALDVVPLSHGKPVWGTQGEEGELWQRVGKHGEAAGLEWAGRWVKFREFPHFQG